MSARVFAQTQGQGALGATPAARGVLQRKCDCGNHASGGACEDCKKKDGILQRATDSPRGRTSGDAGEVPPIVYDVLRAPGESLDAPTRAFMEPRFGHDFSQVRVHTDAKAAESARAVNALAYTVGRNVVFGAGRYAPHADDGRRLLAHELTHTVQQSRFTQTPLPSRGALEIGEADDVHEREAIRIADSQADAIDASPMSSVAGRGVIQRQVNKPPAQPTAAGWGGCPQGKIAELNSELSNAAAWVSDAISDLASARRPARTTGALGRYLSTDAAHVANIIVPTLKQMLSELRGGAKNFKCLTQQQCIALNSKAPDAAALATHPISLCERYFTATSDATERAGDLIHETGHHAGLGGDTYEWTWPFPGLSVSERLRNADSFTAFVVTNHYSWHSPITGPIGLGVKAGASLQFGKGPVRYAVTAELDANLKKRVFHFFDLQLHQRFDVDTQGAIIYNLSSGARIFAPTALSRVPLHLDLKAGFALGYDPAQADKLQQFIFGPSAEAGVGVQSGHFGASLSYRHIWNVMSKNPDINAITISGELNF